jgi:hypothetical protein
MTDRPALTENGAIALDTTGSKCLDFFTRITRNAPVTDYIPSFIDAWNENPETTIKILMNMRDIRKGKGEKLIPQTLLFFLKKVKPVVYQTFLRKFIELGYWKDLLVLCEFQIRYADVEKSTFNIDFELELFATQLKEDMEILSKVNFTTPMGISLCSKWAPSEKGHYDHHPMMIAQKLQKVMGLKPKEYRQMLSKLRSHLKILEGLMASGNFDQIDFSHLPAVAHKKMRYAFGRETNSDGKFSQERKLLKIRYDEYLAALRNKDSKVKINTTGIQPHELVATYLNSNGECSDGLDETIEAQWATLVQKIKDLGTFDNTMAIVDVSGSMCHPDNLPMQVSIALGILVASCTSGSYKQNMITFSETPEWFQLDTNASLQEQVTQTRSMSWGGSTNLIGAFDLILQKAVENGLNPDQMVEQLFIFTDMQFDQVDQSDFQTTFQTIKYKYAMAGYAPPKIICWNLRTSNTKTLPVKSDTDDVALLSGFSSELLKCVLEMSEFNPMTMLAHILEPYEVSLDEWDGYPINSQYVHIDMRILENVIRKSQIKKSFKGDKQIESDSECDSSDQLLCPDNNSSIDKTKIDMTSILLASRIAPILSHIAGPSKNVPKLVLPTTDFDEVD